VQRESRLRRLRHRARDLSPFKTTTIDLTLDKPGEFTFTFTFTFTCGMNMMRGKLVVES